MVDKPACEILEMTWTEAGGGGMLLKWNSM